MCIVLKLLVFIALFINTYGVRLKDYCKNSKNTPCYYGCGRSSRCGATKDGFNPLTNKLRAAILHKHNSYRNIVAEGNHAPKLPKATNMLAMSYDKETEFIAACYIKQCIYDHDKVRITLDGTKLGQNIDTQGSKTIRTIDEHLLEHSVQRWFDEISILDTNNSQSLTTKFTVFPQASHLTQMLWGTTKFIGCAAMHSIRKKGLHSYDVICNYRPSGNIEGGKLYISGSGNCTVQNKEYPGLCGHIRPFDTDKYDSPFNLSKGLTLHPLLFISKMSACIMHYLATTFYIVILIK